MTIQLINLGTTPNDGTGDDPRTAGGKINANFTALSEHVDSPMWHSAVGDGVTDDTAAWQDAIDEGAPVIDGRGLTYKINSTLTVRSNLEIRNATFDFSDAASGDVLFYAEGTLGTEFALTADRSRYSLSVPVSSAATFAHGDYVWLYSNATYETSASTKQGEICFVLSASGTTIGLRDQTHADYLTADSAKVRKFAFVENVTLRNCRLIGAGDGTTAGGQDQYGVRFAFAKNVRIIDCRFEHFDYSMCDFATCLDVVVDRCEFESAADSVDGASYGVTFTHGCQHGKVTNSYFVDMRHGVGVGGTNAVNRYIEAIGNTMQGMRAGGLDCHEGGEYISYHNNQLSNAVGNLGSGSQNGIQIAGGTCSIVGNTIRGTYEVAIAVQQWSKVIPQCVIADNLIENSDGTGTSNVGILVQRKHTTAVSGVTISGNTMGPGLTTGIQVDAESGPIEHLSIEGNTVNLCDSRGIYVRTQGSQTILYLAITGNVARVNAGGDECILLSGAAATSIQVGSVSGNATHDGTYGVRGVNTDYIATVGNALVSASTSAATVAGGNSVTANNA